MNFFFFFDYEYTVLFIIFNIYYQAGLYEYCTVSWNRIVSQSINTEPWDTRVSLEHEQ